MDTEEKLMDEAMKKSGFPPKEENPNLQKEIPEAVASASYTIISPNGFPLIFTVRQASFQKLLEDVSGLEVILVKEGYQPDLKRGGRVTKKPQETVPNRACPKCGNPLVYFEAKGQKHIRCSTQKWNPVTKQATGCDFVEWADNLLQKDERYTYRGVPPAQQEPTSMATPGFEPATQAQVELIKNKWPDQYKEGLSKTEASQLISAHMEK